MPRVKKVKIHTMKAKRRDVGIVPLILNLSTTWR
jgi:hypothetical protein